MLGSAAVVAWVVVSVVALSSARGSAPMLVHVYVLGIDALWLAFGVAAAAVVVTLASYVRRGEVATSPWPWRDLGISYAAWWAVLAVAFLGLGAERVDGWLPAHFTQREPIVRMIRVLLGSAVGFATVAAWRWGWQRRYRALPLWTIALHFVVVRVAFHAAVWRVFDPNWWLLELGGLTLVTAGAFELLRGRSIARHRGFAVGAALAAVAATTTLVRYGSSGSDRARLREVYPAAADLMGLVQARFDFDGDGFAAVLGGLDCDDDDPEVSPGALERVGNGIDDNCAGGDLAPPVTLPAPPRRGQGRARSVVLVTIDALRADHVTPQVMPNLSAFAGQAAVFDRAYAQAPFTDNSVRSLMTGRYPMDFDGGTQFFGQEPSMAELLRGAGYTTHAIRVLHGLTPYAFMGFETVDDALAADNEAHDAVTSDRVIDRALEAFDRLDAGPEPFFLWVHLFDPHADYVAHAEAPFTGDTDADRYRAEVWFTDRHLGRLLAHVQSRHFDDRGVLAVTADHGELLGEHGVSGHALWMYEPAVRVPLLLWGIDVPAVVTHTRVRLLDVYATVLELSAGIVADSDGASLTTLWREPGPDRNVFARTTYGGEYQRAGWVGDDKLVQDMGHGTEALYDLGADPAEGDNLLDAQPERAATVREAIGRQWDRSVNDVMLQRKLALLPSRQVDPETWAKFERHVLERDCARGESDACARLRAHD